MALCAKKSGVTAPTGKTLYVSDLDGTLLSPEGKLTDAAADLINGLSARGLLFSYATARSIHTASKITERLPKNTPSICHNGAFIIENATGKRLVTNAFDGAAVAGIFAILRKLRVSPIVYSLRNGAEKYSYLPDG